MAFVGPLLVAAVPIIGKAFLSFALSGVVASLAGKPRRPKSSLMVTSRQAAAAHQIIYGRAKVGGVVVADFTTGSNADPLDNTYLHRVVALAAHECEEIESVWLDDEELTVGDLADYVFRVTFEYDTSGATFTLDFRANSIKTSDYDLTEGASISVAQAQNVMDAQPAHESGSRWINTGGATPTSAVVHNRINRGNLVSAPEKYRGLVRVKEHLGADNQAADSQLVSEVTDWTTDHRLRGICYVYLRFEYDRATFPSGVPEIRAVVKGRKVFDPRASPTVGVSSQTSAAS